ncbi:MAG: PP2C family protein-serine/threonine phosphatase [Gammaproteobacteria bacterium]
MNVETAQVSRRGDRDQNQDRAYIIPAPTHLLLTLADGMGGHVSGDLAAETAVDMVARAFRDYQDGTAPAGFLHDSIARAHRAVAALRPDLDSELRPRTTITACVIKDGQAQWAHVGDSRVYLIRGREVVKRTRDHSAVEIMAEQGLIDEADLANHPLRNFVDQCLGGEPGLPLIEIGEPQPLRPGDVVLLCSDGFWGSFSDAYLAQTLGEQLELRASLESLALEAELRSMPVSDNVTVAAVRWQP